MDIKKCIDILEEHRENLEDGDIPSSLNELIELYEALDFAIDSLKAVGESLKEENYET